MPEQRLCLAELPTDIILDIVPYLSPGDFLALCATSKAFATLRLDPAYWRHLTRSTYRLPNQPLFQADGARWKSLYQRFLTESRAYTWGRLNRLGHSWAFLAEIPRVQHARWANRGFPVGSGFAGIGWPTEMDGVRRMKPIVDLQCGGYSTTVLDSVGDLHCTGSIEGSRDGERNYSNDLRRLTFPPAYPQGDDRAAATTIAQFSSGRVHILGLSDSGKIWVWTKLGMPALQVKFLQVDLFEDGTPLSPGESGAGAERVRWVVAGWDCSSAYVARTGIVVWHRKSLEAGQGVALAQDDGQVDGFEVDSETIPDTSYRRPTGNAREPSGKAGELGRTVGEVISHVALEGFIVFLTDLGKVFAARHGAPGMASRGAVELDGFEPLPGKGRMKEIKGSFRSFAVFNTGGDVVLGDKDLLESAWAGRFGGDVPAATPSGAAEPPSPKRPAALQDRGIISLAFGDWHKLALTARGHIISFGRAPQSCGCLGLGRWDEGSVLRGVGTSTSWTLDSELVGSLADEGRRVWFSPESREWLKYMMHAGVDREDLSLISGARPDRARHVHISEWFEREGADWDMHEDLDDETQPWGQGEPSYLAVSISAAGWHSGALVLTNEHRIRRAYDAHKAFLPLGPGEPEPPGEGVLTGALRWASSLLQGSGEEGRVTATEDHVTGREHAYYHSGRGVESTLAALPPAGRHAVRMTDVG
ncbi:MAG: hypothetical protein M1832_004477 [Thelocarpon impressellum]|nr:MAG: hypothetical protein M1832_004477 [Thelocarpon impressellum]